MYCTVLTDQPIWLSLQRIQGHKDDYFTSCMLNFSDEQLDQENHPELIEVHAQASTEGLQHQNVFTVSASYDWWGARLIELL